MPADQLIHDAERVEYDPGQAPGEETMRRKMWELQDAVEQQQYAAAFLRQTTKRVQQAREALAVGGAS